MTTIDGPQDIRLVVADMDGTLLDADSQIPNSFWDMLSKLQERGIPFVPASGRQFQTLEKMFGSHSDTMSFIAENGNVVSYKGDIIEVHGVGHDITEHIINTVEHAVESGTYNIGLVICGLHSAYIQRIDQPFVDECRKYYTRLTEVEDLHDVLALDGETILKLAIFDFGDAEAMAHELLAPVVHTPYMFTVSGAHWVDIMNEQTDKGRGVAALQKALHVTPEQTAVFGDYLNDEGMLREAAFSFAMGNAHDQVKNTAAYIAPANTEAGVMQVIDKIIA